MGHLATQITRGALSNNAVLTVAGGEPVEIVGFIVENPLGGTNRAEVELKEFGTDTVIQKIETQVAGGKPTVMSIPFKADKGVTFDPVGNYNAGISVTVLHKAPGSESGSVAPRYSFQKMDASPLTIVGGASVIVYGVTVTNAHTTLTRVVQMKDNDDNVICTWTPQRSAFERLQTPFIADNGVKFTINSVDTNVSVTCFHSNPGA